MIKINTALLCIISLLISVNSIAQKNDSTSIKIENLGDSINSSFQEYAPVISADGSLIMFTTKRPMLSNKKKIFEQIWYSELNSQSASWKASKALPPNINIPFKNISNIALSNDAHKLLLYIDDLSGTGDIYESELIGIEWTNPIKLPEPINTKYHESSASYSPDLKTIYFVSDRPKGLGGRDIYSCEQDKNGKWGKATNLKTINSDQDEEAVFIHPDGSTIYYSSRSKGGLGGYDIYKTQKINNEWSAPINIGAPINTEGDDLFFVMEANGKTAFYSSDQKGTKGGKDLFKISFITHKKAPDLGPKLALLKGVVSDEKTGQLLESEIELIDNEKHEIIAKFKSNASTGKYLISLPSGKNYGINVNAVGYIFQSENVNLPDSSAYHEIIKDFKLKKIEIGTKIILNNIFFDYDKATIKMESKSELERLDQLLVDNISLKIEISGHTDNKGSETYNQKLSEARAKTIVDFLITHGVNRDRLEYKGCGFTQPVSTNETEEGRQLNRRTEFKIISK